MFLLVICQLIISLHIDVVVGLVERDGYGSMLDAVYSTL